MARRSPEPEVILSILLDRVLRVPQPETAKRLGYKHHKSLTNLIERYGIADTENQIRIAIIGQASMLPPEAQKVNSEYDKKLGEIGDRLMVELDKILSSEKPDDQPALSELDRLKLLQTAVKTIEETRQARVKIACATAESQKKEVQVESTADSKFNELVND